MSARRHITAALFVALLFPACSTGPELDIKIDESPQGAVYLKRISERSFQVAHPIKIDPSTIALALSGIVIRDNQGRCRIASEPRTPVERFQGVKSATLRRSSPKVSGTQHRINRWNSR